MTVGLLFSGQGAQRVGMGKSLYDASATARRYFDAANDILGWDLKEVCFEGPEEKLTETRVCQPALYVHSYVAYQLLREKSSLGATVAIGLSLGELTALAAAEVFNFETGLKLVSARGQFMQEACEQTTGGMVSLIGGTREMIDTLCQKYDVEVGNVNCLGQVVVSGTLANAQKLAEEAKIAGFKMVVPLKVAGAYHSKLMHSASEAFAEILAKTQLEQPKMKVYRNVDGQLHGDAGSIRDALVRQIVSTVQFERCANNAIGDGMTSAYECGPGGVLSGLMKRIHKDIKVTSIAEIADVAQI